MKGRCDVMLKITVSVAIAAAAAAADVVLRLLVRLCYRTVLPSVPAVVRRVREKAPLWIGV